MNYMVSLVTTDTFAKEVKLFGLGQYFIERYRLIANAFYDSQRSQLVRRYMTGFALGNLSTIVDLGHLSLRRAAGDRRPADAGRT